MTDGRSRNLDSEKRDGCENCGKDRCLPPASGGSRRAPSAKTRGCAGCQQEQKKCRLPEVLAEVERCPYPAQNLGLRQFLGWKAIDILGGLAVAIGGIGTRNRIGFRAGVWRLRLGWHRSAQNEHKENANDCDSAAPAGQLEASLHSLPFSTDFLRQ